MGTITLHQEIEGVVRTITLQAGEATINPPGVWHTADMNGTVSAIFITPALGRENRPR